MDFIDADPALSGDDHSEEENDEVATLSDEELIDDESQEENGASDHAQLDQLMEQAEEEEEQRPVKTVKRKNTSGNNANPPKKKRILMQSDQEEEQEEQEEQKEQKEQDRYPNPQSVEEDEELRQEVNLTFADEVHHLIPLNEINYAYVVKNLGNPDLLTLSRHVLHELLHEMKDRSQSILEDVSTKTVTVEKIEGFLQTELNPHTTTHENIIQLISKHMASCLTILRCFKKLGICCQKSGNCEIENCNHCMECEDFGRISLQICNAVTVVKDELICWLKGNKYIGIRPSTDEDEAANVSVCQTLDIESNNFSPTQRLILRMLENLKTSNLRRYRDRIYKQIRLFVLQDVDGEEIVVKECVYYANLAKYNACTFVACYLTHSWEPECEIKQYVYRLADKSVDFQSFMDLTSCGAEHITKYLSACSDPDFRELAPNRMQRAFSNGILDFTRETFYIFNTTDQDKIPSHVVCTQYYDTPFPHHHFFTDEWENVPTPVFNKILRDQKLSVFVRFIFYAFMGRLLYPLREEDNWQVIFFIRGVAQSGKSTIGNIAKSFYKPEDVAVMSSNIEGTFGLDAIADMMLYICFEVTSSWNLPRADFQSIICGEDISVAGKLKKARTVSWSVPGLLLGNELGGELMRDSKGSIGRRLVVADFKNKITQADTELDKKLRSELPALIYKCFLAYKLLRNNCGTKTIWEILPKYFKVIQKEISIETNPIKEFLMNGDEVVFHPTLEVPRSVFEAKIRSYLAQKKVSMSRPDINDALKEYGIQLVHKTGTTTEGGRHKGVFLIGVGLKESNEAKNLEDDCEEVIIQNDTHDNEWNQADDDKEYTTETSKSNATPLLTAKFNDTFEYCMDPENAVQFVKAGPPPREMTIYQQLAPQTRTAPPPPSQAPPPTPQRKTRTAPSPQRKNRSAPTPAAPRVGFKIL
jgi:hypothetical protein